jgi:hypothetical protein
VVDGNFGELSILVDGQKVAKKKWLVFKPSVEKVVEAVRAAAPVSATP